MSPYLIIHAVYVHLLLSYVGATKGSSHEVSHLAAELCQYLELNDTCHLLPRFSIFISGVEGQVDTNKYTLRGVAVVFRHGERSPIVKDNLSKLHDCAPFREEDKKRFEDFTKILDSKEFRTFLKVDKKFNHYPFYPLRSECSPGNLTAEGSLQLLRLGNHLRKAYENSNLFNREHNLEVKVTVSPFRRTFQSAVAFISTFLFPMKESIDEIHVKYSNVSFHCTDSFCQCPAAPKWRRIYEKQHLKYFLNDTTGLREKTHRIFGGIESTRRSKDPFQIMDVLLGRYVCRRHPLPCAKDGECVTFDLLKEMFNAGNKFITARLLTAEAQAILGYVARMGDELKESPKRNKIKVFSGHDVTVGPVLRVLRIPFVDFPRYAAHVVFEIYHDEKGQDFLRLVYNGEDRTAEQSFCGGQDMCPMSAFTRFVRTEIFASLGFSNVTQLCNPSQTPQPNNAYE